MVFVLTFCFSFDPFALMVCIVFPNDMKYVSLTSVTCHVTYHDMWRSVHTEISHQEVSTTPDSKTDPDRVRTNGEIVVGRVI